MASNAPEDLADAVEEFDRASCGDRVAAADRHVEDIRQEFPLADWPSLSAERYALGPPDSKSSSCYRLEWGSPELGSIRGGSARKLIIYARQDGTGWFYDPTFASHHQAWDAVRSGFVRAFELAGAGQVDAVDDIDVLRSGPAVTAKAIFIYYPGELLPIYSQVHLRHFLRRLTGEVPAGLAPLTANRHLLQYVRETGRFDGWHPVEIMYFLYWWADPQAAPAIVKIAPGEGARFWPECLSNGYICVGWDEVGDLSAFASEEDFRAAFAERFPYNGNQSMVTRKAREVWRLASLEPGDRVVANEGTSKVLAIGTVVEPGYVWRPERTEHKHTVTIDWDESCARTLPEPIKRWGVTTVGDVPGTVWRSITGEQSAIAEPGSESEPAAVILAAEDRQLQSLADALQRKGQVVLYGPPGTGKTYTALRFAAWWLARGRAGLDPLARFGTPAFQAVVSALGAPPAAPDVSDESYRGDVGQLTQVTFHPSYGYEDFIEGFKPTLAPGGGLNLRLVDGIFKRVCRSAAADPDQPYLVVIDEINRGNLPKIFGELITLLEVDKRGLAVRLPQSGESFTVPPNVHVLATMNTADRSIRLLDAALRRRFAFHELLPDREPLEGAFIGKLHLADLLTTLNARIRVEVGRERQVGQAFLLRDGQPVATEEDFAAAFRGDILPLLQEYACDDYGLLDRLLGRSLIDEGEQRLRDLPDADLIDALYTELQADRGGQPSL